MDEFQLIRHYFSSLKSAADDVLLGIGDDAALLRVPSAHELVVTTDTLVAGRHFPADTTARDIGWKSLAVNLSDLAAMGATPRWVTLALTLPEVDADWLHEFCAGFGALLKTTGVNLVGGDTTRGPLSITVTALGVVPTGQALRRDGAQLGDLVCVTGTLGDAALALQLHTAQSTLPPALRERLDRPQPRIAAGLALRDLAHAAIDLSDGLAGDLAHVLDASGVGAVIESAELPQSYAFATHTTTDQRLALQAQGGDDYELCVCLAPSQLELAQSRLDVPLTPIGRVVTEPGLRFVDANGVTIGLTPHGYRHFQ